MTECFLYDININVLNNHLKVVKSKENMDNKITEAKRFSEIDINKIKSKLPRIGQLIVETIISLLPLFLMLLFLYLVDIGLEEGAWLILDGDLVWCSLTSLIMVFFEVFLNEDKQKGVKTVGIIFNVLYALAIAAVYNVIKFVNNIHIDAELLHLKEQNAFKLIIAIFIVTFIINIANIMIFWRKN